ncbi:MAG: Nif3-like dinuclear metal center hexameric protein [Proteobacteria bacterium]|nr:Nif3-like dinuclear metal center hexameric protein [Pseudomonadota bacterium]
MEKIAPASLAEAWDNIGLQIGNHDDEAKGIMVALDPSLAAIEKAAERGFNLLLTHHPLFFSDIKSINLNSPMGQTIEAAIKGSVAIFTAHTNLDSVEGGVSDMLADVLLIEDRSPLEPAQAEGHVKCGLGRIGTIKKRPRLKEITAEIKKILDVPKVRVLGDLGKRIETVALCGGSGGSLIHSASQQGADLFISGDIRYHQAREAEELGLSIIDVGHFSSEKIVINGLKNILKMQLDKKGFNIPLEKFSREKEPFIIL